MNFGFDAHMNFASDSESDLGFFFYFFDRNIIIVGC